VRKEVRLWTGKSKSWDNPYSTDLFKSYRSFLEVWFDSEWKGFGISLSGETESPNGEYSPMFADTTIGFQWTFGFGYEVHQYDGFWHRFSLGPFFVSWYN
jgi:hypothetical protein